MNHAAPIVVLDSGLGGLTVARAIRHALPHDDIIYFGDTARLPYGSKSPHTVTGFVRQIIQYVEPLHPKHIVFACNTATALALAALRAEFPHLPMSGVIDPGARAAAAAAGPEERPPIGVIATEATIRSRAYQQAILRRRNHAKLILQPTPLLVPVIEEGRLGDDPLVRLALKQYLDPMVRHGLKVLVLGCTHYPILRDAIEETVGPDVAVIDSAAQCAQDVLTRLQIRHALRSEGRGSLRCTVTDDAPRFARLASRFLGFAIPEPTCVPTDELPSADVDRVRVAV